MKIENGRFEIEKERKRKVWGIGGRRVRDKKLKERKNRKREGMVLKSIEIVEER